MTRGRPLLPKRPARLCHVGEERSAPVQAPGRGRRSDGWESVPCLAEPSRDEIVKVGQEDGASKVPFGGEVLGHVSLQLCQLLLVLIPNVEAEGRAAPFHVHGEMQRWHVAPPFRLQENAMGGG